MAKSNISSGFAKFASKTTRGSFDEARKQESMATGCPLPIGATGVAVVGEIVCKETKVKQDGTGGDPLVMINLEVETPEEFRGKKLQGSGLMFTIKDGPNSTQADAWARMLDALEGMGLPREIRMGYEDFSEVLDWFSDEPRRVQYTVNKDSYAGNRSGKTVAAVEYFDTDSVPSAETPQVEEKTDPNADYCNYLGKKYKIIGHDSENDCYDLEQVGTGKLRSGVPADKLEMLD